MKKLQPLSTFAISTLALAISANVSMMAQAADALDTVIVTAGKIEADIQKTAVSMQSLSGEKLADSGISSVADVAKLVPGLQLDQTGGGLSATVRIRGMGTPGFSSLDPSVPLFIDGVAQARTGSGFQDLLDVARIEVLRGPQGTLYGRNSTAGAINVWTKDVSTNSWEGSVLAQVGNYKNRELKGTVNVPLIDDKLGARISAFKVLQDGYVKNDYNGQTGQGYADRFGGRAKVLLVATDNLNIQWLTDYSKMVNHPMTAMVEAPANFTTYAAGGTVANPSATSIPVSDLYGKTYADHRNWSLDTNFSNSLTVNWDITEGFLKDHALTSITASQLYKTEQDVEQDFSVLSFATTAGTTKTKSWSQEFRISSDASENWEYVGGLFYYYEDVFSANHTDNALPDRLAFISRDPSQPSIVGLMGQGLTQAQAGGRAARATNTLSQTSNNTDNAAVFGQATYSFTDKLSVTSGLRYSVVKKKTNSVVDGNGFVKVTTGVLSPFPIPSFSIVDHLHQTENDLSGVLKARYQLQDDVMLYASFDRGFKPGGFNRIVSEAVPNTLARSYQKENSNNFEVGAKTQWLDNTVQANIALFHMEFLNYHNQVSDARTNLIIENIKKVTNDGVEIDVQALAAPGLTVGGSATYINPRVKDNAVKGGVSPSNPNGTSLNLSKNQLINDVGQYSANLNAEYAHALSDGPAEGFVRGDLSYRGSSKLAVIAQPENNLYHQGGYTTTNIRFGVRKLDEHWQITGWVNNVFDKEYVVQAGYSLAGYADGLQAVRGAPRMFGVSAQYDY